MPKKPSTKRDYRERINRVIFHIERHLDDPMGLQELAKLACFSPFHFHRIFTAFTGESLADLIRRFRLERSAMLLLYVDSPITEIALGAGYETPAAYTRAFQSHFGVTPSAYREQNRTWRDPGSLLLALDNQDQDNQNEEEPTMKPDIRNTPPLPVLFVRRTGPYDQAAGQAFGVLCQFAGPRGLLGPTARYIGISHDSPHVTDSSNFRYDACVTVDHEVATEGEVGHKNIAGGRYAVFVHAGPYEQFNNTYDQIYQGWLPSSGEQLRDEPCFEVYLNSPDHTQPEQLRTEIWIPIQ
jgi:AraC family transcriptional regulator